GWDEVGAHLEWQVNDALARMATHLEESLGRWDSEWISRRVDQATEQARRRAEQAAERARMRAEQAERRWQRASGQRTAPQKQKASDEERLRVLRMLEEGKITLEQASELIVALEGR
ncbi:MAG: alanine-zipper protein, partial [Anaerolineae bacterium]